MVFNSGVQAGFITQNASERLMRNAIPRNVDRRAPDYLVFSVRKGKPSFFAAAPRG